MKSRLVNCSKELESQIETNIEKYRKGDFTIKTNSKNCKISVKLKNHKFRFGANLFMLDQFTEEDEKWKNQVYKDKFKKVFNMATLPFYWADTEPEQGKLRYDIDSPYIYRRPPIDMCIKYCEENNIEPREHALCYGVTFPKWLKEKYKFDNEKVKELLEKRVKEIADRYADKINTIEVTNEMEYNGNDMFDYFFSPDYIYDCFKMAEKYFPNNNITINDFSASWVVNTAIHRRYYYAIKDAINRGARIDEIGLQFHMFYKKENYEEYTKPYYCLDNLQKGIERLSEFKKKFEVTEITIPAFSNEETAEQEQADIIEDLYTYWFSVKDMTQIIYWNLVDGYAAFVEKGNMTAGENIFYGGLLRYDMTEKPSFKRLNYLINEKWNTNLSLTTDENGEVSFRGFYGDYEVEIEDGDKKIAKTITFNESKKVDLQ